MTASAAAAAAAAMIGAAIMPMAAAALNADTIPSTTGTRVLAPAALRDPDTVMQSFARTSASGTWVVAQMTGDGIAGKTAHQHSADGDNTLTHLTAGGAQMSWMRLKGFGHAMSLSLQSANGLWVWIESNSSTTATPFPGDGFGTRVARFKWVGGKTITPSSAGVRTYNPVPGAHYVSPSVDLHDQIIGVRYMDPGGAIHVRTYKINNFLNHVYTPLATMDQPAPGPGFPGAAPWTDQGWTLLPGGQSAATLTGDAYSADNPDPGDTVITTWDAAGILSQALATEDTGLTRREPEGMAMVGGTLVHGYASGAAGARRASMYARSTW